MRQRAAAGTHPDYEQLIGSGVDPSQNTVFIYMYLLFGTSGEMLIDRRRATVFVYGCLILVFIFCFSLSRMSLINVVNIN